MNKPSDYTRMINRFSTRLNKMLDEDFPANEEITVKTDNAIMSIQYAVIGAFLKKGTD